MHIRKQKVFVGLSGGVDSSVTAALLLRAGYDVTGVFIKVWSPDWLPCTWRDERRDAMRVAAHLDIPFLTFDFEDAYKKNVVDYLLAEYQRGRTPNPDVLCNKEIKFGSFLHEALGRGADFIATGHYAQNVFRDNTFHLLESVDTEKDQSYFLWTLGQEALRHTLFPVGTYKKQEVRNLARHFNLPTATKKDSQGICFLGPVDMKEFLAHYVTPQRGEVLDEAGNSIGWHPGAVFFTQGERHGFTITKPSAQQQPQYIIAKDITHNTLTVAPHQHSRSSTSSQGILASVHWISPQPPAPQKKYQARWRYRQKTSPCFVHHTEKNTVVTFDTPQENLSPGQSLVLYDNGECCGGGILV